MNWHNWHTNSHTVGVQQKLIGLADVELQVSQVALCNEALCQSYVKNSLWK